MGHLVTNQPWGTVDLDTSTGRVFVRQDWRYTWSVYPGAQPWTHREKLTFHRSADRAIWGLWSNRLHLSVVGRAPFRDRRIPVNFDVRWVTAGTAHYDILAWKVPPGSTATSPVWSQVDWNKKFIQLSSADLLPRGAANDAGASTNDFLTVPHEFGHTFYLPDEYGAPTRAQPNAHLPDTHSIMNVGRRIRGRHLVALCNALHRLVPAATFRA